MKSLRMFKDPYFIITFQLTLIGIVLIGGLFLIWKAISRIEENVDMLLIHKERGGSGSGGGSCFISGSEKHHEECDPIKMMESDVIMQQLFNSEVIEESSAPPPDVATSVEEVLLSDDVAPSEVSESPMSRSKLRQMPLEKIKLLCEEKGIATEGTKNQLIDKLLVA